MTSPITNQYREDDLIELVNRRFLDCYKPLLNEIETIVLRGSLQSLEYKEIADKYDCSDSYIRQVVGSKLWKRLGVVFNCKVSKKTVKSVLEQAMLREKQQNKAQASTHSSELDLIVSFEAPRQICQKIFDEDVYHELISVLTKIDPNFKESNLKIIVKSANPDVPVQAQALSN